MSPHRMLSLSSVALIACVACSRAPDRVVAAAPPPSPSAASDASAAPVDASADGSPTASASPALAAPTGGPWIDVPGARELVAPHAPTRVLDVARWAPMGAGICGMGGCGNDLDVRGSTERVTYVEGSEVSGRRGCFARGAPGAAFRRWVALEVAPPGRESAAACYVTGLDAQHPLQHWPVVRVRLAP